MRDFNNFTNQTQKTTSDGSMDMLKSFARKYEGASEDEIISQIMIEAEKGRRNGTLTDADIDRFKNMIYPMLNQKQREKLEKVVRKLKKN